jgi:hypothetical protein
MSRGIGKIQQAILDVLADEEYGCTDLVTLAARFEISGPQARRAVRSLESRGLVAVSRETIGWKGVGKYGPLGVKDEDTQHFPTVHTLKENDDLPWREGFVAAHDFETFHRGMPVFGLRVWLPKARISFLRWYLMRKMEETRVVRHTTPVKELAEYARLTGHDFLDELRGAL